MNFSSLPPYLDPHPNWHLQTNGGGGDHPQLLQASAPPAAAAAGGGLGSIRPGSMAERARMAKISQPEAALKCPRCDSSNTKFCYYNNYSLTQPRHFCKACRRYWTRGGSLRNVPVGGGCRRNKRTKGSRASKSPARVCETLANSSSLANPSSSGTRNLPGHHLTPLLQFPLLPSSLQLSDLGGSNIPSSFPGIQPPFLGGSGGDFSISGNSTTAAPWRLQQFPMLSPTGMYQLDGEGVVPPGFMGAGANDHQLLGSKPLEDIKMEENQGLNLSRNFMGILTGNEQYWSGNSNAWTDMSNYTPPTTHQL